jgi:hypothetical protein
VRKAIASIGTGPQARLLALSAISFRPYSARHGYELHMRTEPLDRRRPAPWSKILLLRQLVERYDVVVWLDADLVIVDGRVDLASEIEPGRFLYLVEHETNEGRMPNSGVMLLRGGADAARMLDEVWAQEDLVEHRWWENAAICRVLGYELDPVGPGNGSELLREHTKLISPRWNSIRDAPAPRARFRHYPGYSLKVRAAFMARDLVVVAARRAAGRW